MNNEKSLIKANEATLKQSNKQISVKNKWVKIKNDLTESNLKGKIKSITEIEYKAISRHREIKKGYIQSSEITLFNKKGNIIGIDECFYEFEGNLSEKVTYKYNDKENKIERYVYKHDGSLSYRDTYDRDTYKYDDKGNKIEWNIYKPDDNSDSKISFRGKVTFKNNEKGNKIEKCFYEPDGNLQFKINYKYDDKENEIEECAYYPDLELQVNRTYKYNSDKFDIRGNWLERTEFKDGIIEKIREREITYY
jgi:hypothetical protein